MSGLPTSAIPNRALLVGAAAELATVLRGEIRQLTRDAQAFELQGRPLLAANIRTMRRRLARVLAAAEAVLGGERPTTPSSSRSSRVGHPSATFSTGGTS